MTHTRTFSTLFLLLTLTAHASAQTPAAATPPAPAQRKAERRRAPRREADPLAAQRRAQAVALLASVGDEAAGFRDEALRARRTSRARATARAVSLLEEAAAEARRLDNNDPDRAVQLAQSFTGEAARVTAVVTLGSAALLKKGRRPFTL